MTMHSFEDGFGDLRAADDVPVGAGASIVISVAAALALAVTLAVAAVSTAAPVRAAETVASAAPVERAAPRDQSFAVIAPPNAGDEGDSSLAPLLVLAAVAGMGAATVAVGRTVGRVVLDGTRQPRRTV